MEASWAVLEASGAVLERLLGRLDAMLGCPEAPEKRRGGLGESPGTLRGGPGGEGDLSVLLVPLVSCGPGGPGARFPVYERLRYIIMSPPLTPPPELSLK